ncbi:MAG TPA: hypothetical protein VJ917_10280 [Saprospiraceae bacterium]|nr:hypothetical protein [Saprospiraceae bacterium]
MKRILLKTFFTFILLLSFSAVLIYWMEAEKEIRVLCSMFEEGDSIEQVKTTLDTANLLNYETIQTGSDQSILLAESPFDLYSAKCSVSFDRQDMVAEVKFSQFIDLNRNLAIIGSLILLSLSGMQFLLSFGFPYGEYFWGGYHKVLPVHLRIGSFVSFLLLSTAMVVLLHQIEWIDIQFLNLPFSELNIFFSLLFLLSTLANINSESEKERMVMTPLASILYFSFLSSIFVM